MQGQTFSTLMLCTVLASMAAVVHGLVVGSLRVENQVEPLGLDVVPRFSWIPTTQVRGTAQTSYRLVVSSPSNANIWDSGVVTSSKSYDIEYAGPQLSSDTTYSWTVQVSTNSDGSASASSKFTTGFLSANDWGASAWIGKPSSSSGVLSLTDASWIWIAVPSPPSAPEGTVVFRKSFAAPAGKTLQSASIMVTGDDQFTFYVDGNRVGAAANSTDAWKQGQRLAVSLSGSSTLFAAQVLNLRDRNNGGPSPAGFLAAIRVSYTDGTTATIFSDITWKASNFVSGFELPSTNDSSWAQATSFGQYGTSPWNSDVIVPGDSSPLSFASSSWVWSSSSSAPFAAPGTLAFRRTVTAPSGKTLQSASILVTGDDQFAFYANGRKLGQAENTPDVWRQAQELTVSLSGTSALFAASVTNLADVSTGGNSPAGFLAVIRVTFSDGTTSNIVSDTTWKVNPIIAGFELPSTNDASWAQATSFGQYGVTPWNQDVSLSAPLAEHPAPLLRKEFSINKAIASARLYYAAGGYASFSFNGAAASTRVLTPGFTNYVKEVHYVAIDVKDKIKQGNNAIGVELGRSRYSVTQSNAWSWDNAPWKAEPVVRAVLSLTYTDGSKEKVVTDVSWHVTEGPTRLDDVFGGENYDARHLLAGYDTAGFDSSSWTVPVIRPGPSGALRNEQQPPTRVIETLSANGVTQPVPGSYVVKFERVIAGWVHLTVSGPAGTLITIHYGERLKPDGTVDFSGLGYFANNFQTDRMWLAGTGQGEVFEPKFSYKGFQYIQLQGWPGSPPTADNIQARVVHDDMQTRGGIETSVELLNKMHKAVVYSLLNNAHSIIQDCPTYEKNGWTGDAMLSAEMILTNLDSHNLMAKYVQDLDQSRGDGPPALIVPSGGFGEDAQDPTWHSAFILIPWNVYQYRGDKRILQEHYDSMKSYVNFELGRSPNNIASTGLGDWNTPETNPSGANPPDDSSVSATAFLYKMLTTMQEVATVLGKSSDAFTFSSQADAVKSAFNSAYLNSAAGHYVGRDGKDSGYRQTHNLLALAFGLSPDNSSTVRVAQSIKDDVVARGNHLNTGALGTKWLLPVLSENGQTDAAYNLAVQTTHPSWGFWFENGANSMWEHWALESRSRDHHFLGTFDDWLFKHVAGIKLTSPAFETVSINPLFTSKIATTTAWVDTPYGNITVDWQAEAESLSLNVVVPVGVRATVAMPASFNVANVREGGKTLQEQGQGVFEVNSEESTLVVGSGKYSFTVSR